MHLINSKLGHFYGCQSWDLTYVAVKIFGTSWSKAGRKVWKLPPNSDRALLFDLNNGSHVLDMIYRRFCKMINGMLIHDQNGKMQFYW